MGFYLAAGQNMDHSIKIAWGIALGVFLVCLIVVFFLVRRDGKNDGK